MTKLIRLQESMHRAARAADGFGRGSGAVVLSPAWPGVLGDSFGCELGETLTHPLESPVQLVHSVAIGKPPE